MVRLLSRDRIRHQSRFGLKRFSLQSRLPTAGISTELITTTPSTHLPPPIPQLHYQLAFLFFCILLSFPLPSSYSSLSSALPSYENLSSLTLPSLQLFFLLLYVCVWCVCVRERERERERWGNELDVARQTIFYGPGWWIHLFLMSTKCPANVIFVVFSSRDPAISFFTGLTPPHCKTSILILDTLTHLNTPCFPNS